jgi:hypothetical protein
MAARTVQLPEPIFRRLNALKIRVANETGTIPTNGDIIRYALLLANANENFGNLVRAISDPDYLRIAEESESE